MGYYANKLREELGLTAEQQTETVETPTETVETPSEQPEQTETASEEVSTDNQESEAPVDGDKPSETDNQPEETKDETKEEPAETTEPPSEKPDLSKISKEEKASHAFQRQLSKMKEKHKAELEEQRESLKKEFQQQFDEFKKSVTEKKEAEPVKTRADFDTDDEFIDYLTQRGVDQRLAEIEKQKAEQQAKEAEQKQREAEEQAQRQQVVEYFNANAKTEFGDSYNEFENRLKKGVSNGLAEVLDEAPAVRDFIFSTPDGPLVLNEMLQDRDVFVRVMSRGSNPTLAIIECHDLAREIRQKRSAPVETVPRMPRMGKPGVGASTPTAPDIYNDPAAMLDWVHKRRNR